MSQAPSMPMFWDAYLADTTHLTTEEHGAYLLLLAAMWRRNGSVPDDDRDNARILGLTPARWKRVKERLRPFLMFDDGHISQKNLQKIWKITQERIENNRANGAKGGRPKSNENNDIGKATGSFSVNPNETIPKPDPKPKPKKEDNIRPHGVLWEPPDEIDRIFDERFWPAYPRKEAKPPARKAFRKAMAKDGIEAIMFGLERYVATKPPHQDYAMPASWLNAERWNDEPPPKVNRSGVDTSVRDAFQDIIERATYERDHKI